MREVVGDLFEYPADAVVIPVNWTTKKNGDAVMGAGVAKQAAERWPSLPVLLGHWIEKTGPHVFWDDDFGGQVVVLFPTKHHWRSPSDLSLIESMARGLAGHANHNKRRWKTIALPRLGCGLGGLDWASQVKPLLERYLDDRFVVVHPEAGDVARLAEEGRE